MEQNSHLDWKRRVGIVSKPSESGEQREGEDDSDPSTLG